MNAGERAACRRVLARVLRGLRGQRQISRQAEQSEPSELLRGHHRTAGDWYDRVSRFVRLQGRELGLTGPGRRAEYRECNITYRYPHHPVPYRHDLRYEVLRVETAETP